MVEKKLFHVSLEDPIEMRRQLLESSREIIKILQGIESFKDIKEERTKNLKLLIENTKEIKVLTLKLKESLPKTNLQATPKAKSKTNTIANAKDVKEPEGEEAELGDLEDELNLIEAKLNSIIK